jgi:DNA-binding transcriptional MocR family regulator
MNEAAQTFLYKDLAGEIEAKIHNGTYHPGERLPSIRELHRQRSLSISTVYQAYVALENTGLIEARPKSGYYVAPTPLNRLLSPCFEKSSSLPRKVELFSIVNAVIAAINDPRMTPFGSSSVSSELMPVKHLLRIAKGISVKEMKTLINYPLTEGNPELRRQIALRTFGIPDGITADDIVITNGCMEAVTLCLQAVLKPGDTLAIEKPTHFGLLQYLNAMGILVAEIPTDPQYGVDVDELEKVLRNTPVKACLFIPSFHNPLGALMPDERKEKLAWLTNRYDIPVIEDDIYGELFYEGHQRPSLLKSFDRKNLVMTCSSFSKTLAAGFRIGWVIPGKRFKEKILRLKAGTTVATASWDQYIIAHFLSEGAYERHLRKLRTAVKNQLIRTALAIQKYFPENTRLSIPKGGALLWVQLPSGADGLALYQKALAHKISILPGVVCSADGQFTEYIRIGCGHPFTDMIEKGIQTLGRLVKDSLSEIEIKTEKDF